MPAQPAPARLFCPWCARLGVQGGTLATWEVPHAHAPRMQPRFIPRSMTEPFTSARWRGCSRESGACTRPFMHFRRCGRWRVSNSPCVSLQPAGGPWTVFLAQECINRRGRGVVMPQGAAQVNFPPLPLHSRLISTSSPAWGKVVRTQDLVWTAWPLLCANLLRCLFLYIK